MAQRNTEQECLRSIYFPHIRACHLSLLNKESSHQHIVMSDTGGKEKEGKKVVASKKESNAVTVAVRIRPLNEAELASEMPAVFKCDDGKNVDEHDLETLDLEKQWPFDHVFNETCDNEFIFNTIGTRLVEDALIGYNTVLFMYGQTSSGKTFTLFGGGSHAGVVNHCMEHVYKCVVNSKDTEYVIRMTYAELYNEELKDLLSETPNENLRIIEDPMLGPIIQNISEKPFTSAADIKRLLEEGENRRHFGVTNMNAHSSRSHVLVRLGIEARRVPGVKPINPFRSSWGKDKPTSISTLNLVDLAGSERANKSGTSGDSLKEGSFINKSLLTLGTVIASLTDSKAKHVPYRDSKLTRLLASALGGNARTTMCTCISPASGNAVESLSTLRFASRAKRIVNSVQKNEFQDAKSLANKLALQKAEFLELQKKFEDAKLTGFTDCAGGEMIRVKAADAVKKYRTLRFLMVTAPQIQKAFNKSGQHGHAKTVHQDLKNAIEGKVDLETIVSRHAEMLSKYLPREHRLLERIEHLTMNNETDTLDFDSEDEEEEDLKHIEEIVLEFDSEELKEELECALMRQEEMRVRMGEEERHKTELQGQIDNMTNMLEVSRKLEHGLQVDISELKRDLEGERKHRLEHGEQLQKKIDEARNTVAEREENIAKLEGDIVTSKKGSDVLLGQIKVLEKELDQMNALRKSYENEVVRVKNDNKVQMERLRSNMSNMLKTSGDEGQYLAQHNAQLAADLDRHNDQIASLKEAIVHKEGEMLHLRAELHRSFDEAKLRTDENYLLKEQVQRNNEKVHELEIEVQQLTGKYSASEEENSRIMHDYRETLRHKDDEMEGLREEVKRTKNANVKELEKYFLEQRIQQKTIDDHISTIERQRVEIVKIKSELKSTTDRYEKKVKATNEAKDTIIHSLTETEGKLTQLEKAKQVEGIMRKRRIHELETWIANVQRQWGSLSDTGTNENVNTHDSYDDRLESGSRIGSDDDPDDLSESERRKSYISELSEMEQYGESVSTSSCAPGPEAIFRFSLKDLERSGELEEQSGIEQVAELVASNMVRFGHLRHGVITALETMIFAFNDEGRIRNFLMNDHLVEMEKVIDWSVRVEGVNQRQSAQEKYRQHLEAKVGSQDEQNKRVLARCQLLERENSTCMDDNSSLSVSETYLKAKVEQVESEMAGLLVKVNKLLFDLSETTQSKDELFRERDELLLVVAEQADSNTELQCELSSLQQKFLVLETERNDLMSRFIAMSTTSTPLQQVLVKTPIKSASDTLMSPLSPGGSIFSETDRSLYYI